MLKNRQILLGLTGSIAVYKSAYLTRFLVQKGVDVMVMMTPGSEEFITPLTMSVLSKNRTLRGFTTSGNEWINHVKIGNESDLLLIAPATANTIAKMAHGICDNLLLGVYLSARCPVIIAPAMDADMLNHDATRSNLAILKDRGVRVIEPERGELASGLIGDGRMAEPEAIVDYLESFFCENLPLKGYKLLVTAGPTLEKVDAVRFIANRSSGKMGFALAEAAAILGAEVKLITGQSHLSTKCNNIDRIDVLSSDEMYDACMANYQSSDIIIMAAAVSDYKVNNPKDSKIKKSGKGFTLDLEPTKDILKAIGKKKKKKQFLVGFALETNNEINNANKKLKEKNLDMIVLNSLNDKGAGFESDQNKVTLIYPNGTIDKYNLKPKKEIAKDIINKIIELYVA